MKQRTMAKVAAGIGGLVLVGAVYHYFFPGYCRSAKSKYGLRLEKCPDGDVVQLVTIDGNRLSRAGVGSVTVSSSAVYTIAKADDAQHAAVSSFKIALSLVAADGTESALEPFSADPKKKARWTSGSSRTAEIKLPQVPDGDYKLRARVSSKLGDSVVEMPLGLYAPARIHVLTDRPLYEPGNVVQFRALALRANDLSPIDKRPGTWMVRDPNGTVLLEEKVAAEGWGVVSGSFPLDTEADVGTWTVTWSSGADSGARPFTVQPFTLPRFRVDAAPQRAFYGARQAPVLEGAVVYSSGAPVVGATLEATWSSSGEWPPPPQWLQRDLPRVIEVAANGRFRVTLPEIPDDLRKTATLTARLTATDPAGDRVVGAARIFLSADPIAAEALTELADGLVQGSNNRMYLRVTTADGQPMPGKKILVKRGWEPTDPGVPAELDADSVARLQIDPGPPVNVIVPPMPVRRMLAETGPVVTRTGASDLVSQEDATLADRAAMDRWSPRLESCARWVASGDSSATVGIRVSPAGAIVSAVAGDGDLSRCVASSIGSQRLPSGDARLYSLSFQFRDPKLPTLVAESESSLDSDEAVGELIAAAAVDARTCIDASTPEELPIALAWQVRPGGTKLSASWIRVSSTGSVSAATQRCILAAVTRRTLEEPVESADLGIVRYSVSVPEEQEVVKPQPTILKGYELAVSVDLGDNQTGTTIVRLTPGRVPDIRMRASPVIAEPGGEVEIAILRGPEFSGKLPEKINVRHRGVNKPLDLDDKTRVATFKVPGDASGWYEFSGVSGAIARVFVRSQTDLAVTVTPDAESYQPGQTAKLNLVTTIGGQGAPAAVGLFGVDASLAQLTPLPGADELAGMRPAIQMTSPAFGVLDAQALSLGRIRGGNAAEATVLRVSQVPAPAQLDNHVGGSASSEFDAVAVLTDRFYPVLAELHKVAREWERTAPKSDSMSPERMAALWKQARDAVEASGRPVTDAFGRKLRLHRLPSDLLALTAPQQVVVVGTRLPEDVENWSQWVEKEEAMKTLTLEPVRLGVILAMTLALLACKGRSDEAKSDRDQMAARQAPDSPAATMPGDEPMEAEAIDGVMMDEERAPAKKLAGKGRGGADKNEDFGAVNAPGTKEDDDSGGSSEGARARSWFPETFLFRPLIVTDSKGEAEVAVTVPDRLTSWRVLALAHSRQGSQAGAVTEFLGSLPAYVDPVVPPSLRVGDELRIPIQLVNTGESDLRTALTASVVGGELSAPPSSVTVPARGSSVLYATLRATAPGQLKLAATLGGTDAVVRTARVDPVGKPVRVARSGTLASPRTITIAGPSGGETDRVRLEVFPGALAILRSELSVAGRRGSLADDAFALLLAGRAPKLLERLGDTPEAKQLDQLRTMTILSTQRVVRHARTLTPDSATLLAEAALSHGQNPILDNIGKRAVAYLEREQLPDGTCGGVTGWTLQRLLVATADCARAASESRGLVARASGSFERNARHINDSYTAAAVLAAGGASDSNLRDSLREKVRAAIKQNKDGSRYLEVPNGVVRADGARPSRVEATALAALALRSDDESAALVPDLGATVLAGYSRGYGWGDGRANLVCMKALVELFDKPIPADVKIELAMDGTIIASGAIDADKLREVMILEARDVGAAGEHTFTVTATPAVAGLGFALESTTWVNWPPMARNQGLEIIASTPADLRVGNKSTWRIDVAAPAGDPLSVSLVLPAGVQLERSAIESLVSAGTIADFRLTDEELTININPLAAGAAFSAEIPVIPTVAGRVWSGAATVTMGAVSVEAPPTRWTVK